MVTEHDATTTDLDAALQRFSSHTTAPDDALRIFAAARQRCPVAHSEEHDGFYMILGYDEVKRATSDHAMFSSEPQVARPIDDRPPFAAIEMDPPRHADWRVLFDQAVTPHVVTVLEPVIRAAVTRHIDDFIERGTADLVEELTHPVPAEAICHLVGIDDELVYEVRDRANAMFAAQGDPEEFPRRAAEFAELAIGEARRRQQEPREDYLTYLTSVEVEGKPLDDAGIFAVLSGFLGAGHHSTTSAMSSLILEVFNRESVREQIAADPERLVPVAVEETLRLRPPFFGFYRRTTDDLDVSGVEIPSGSDVYLGWASANRDSAVFDQSDEFRLDRGRNKHLSFGSGIHTCPGAPLARLELRIALEELLRRVPDLTLEIDEPEYVFSGGDSAHIVRLPVRFTPGTKVGDAGASR